LHAGTRAFEPAARAYRDNRSIVTQLCLDVVVRNKVGAEAVDEPIEAHRHAVARSGPGRDRGRW